MSRIKPDMRNKLLICLGLVVVTFAVYFQVLGHEFITTFDDDKYVTENPYVQAGLTSKSIAWAFTSVGYSANWHPLTWISHMLDYKFFSLRPMGHHLTSLLLHILSAMLLFLVFSKMTGSLWKSAFVAALFALHPLHVESVAWVAERKDVLSTVFWMLTMLAYVWYARRPGIGRYLAVCACFVLGLLSKPMLVTLPVALLLIDYWPLRRSQPWVRLILEKLPLFALAIGSSVMTFIAQRGGEAVATTDVFPIPARIGNALVSYVEYLLKMVWPAKLGIYYPHPGASLPVWQVIGSTLALIAITAAVIRYRRYRYLLTGWLWYVVTLAPVIGIIQVGGQAMADRYTYVPLIGIFVIFAWGVPDLFPTRQPEQKPKSKQAKATEAPNRTAILALPALIVLAALSVVTYVQLGYWKSPEALFAHTLAVTDEDRNERAQLNLAVALSTKGRTDEAIRHYRKAISIVPGDFRAHSNFGLALLEKGDLDGAIEQFETALSLQPNSAASHTNLAIVLDRKGHTRESIEEFNRAIKLDPNLMQAHYQLALVLQRIGDPSGAAEHYERAHELSPAHPIVANMLAWLRATSKDPKVRNGDEAVRLAEIACRAIDYKEPGWLDTLAAAYAEAGRFDDAIATSKKALVQPVMSKAPELAKDIAKRIELYKAHKAYHE